MELFTVFAILTGMSFVPVVFDLLNSWRPTLASRLPQRQTGISR
jgi:hypothetical protein